MVAAGEQPPQQQLVGRRTDAGNEIRRIESRQPDILEIMIRIAVEHHFAELNERKVGMVPDLRDVERIEAGGFGLFRRHDLHIEFPFREVAALDRLIKLPCGETRVRFRRLFRLPGARRRNPAAALK